MTHPHQQTTVPLGGTMSSSLLGAGAADEEQVAKTLDTAIPLLNASHADVVEYVVETPLRYAECLAVLSDGRKVGLSNPRQFVGWSDHDCTRSLLFQSDGKHYEFEVEGRLLGQAPGCIRKIFLEVKPDRRAGVARKFIGTDGELVILPTPSATI